MGDVGADDDGRSFEVGGAVRVFDHVVDAHEFGVDFHPHVADELFVAFFEVLAFDALGVDAMGEGGLNFG